MKLLRLPAARTVGGENPWWDHRHGLLYYIDNTGKKIHCFDPATETTRSWSMPRVITTLAVREGGGSVVTLTDGIYSFDFDREALQPVAPLANPPSYVYNDGKVDRRGRLIVGGSTKNFDNPQPDGGLFRFDPDRRLVQLDDGTHYSNGPCFSPDDTILYFADSWLKTVYAYDYDIATGAVANRRAFINTTEWGGLPDGATVDCEGRLWVAIYQGGAVVAYTPDGKVDQVIKIPTSLVTSVMFGGEKLDQLYVTTMVPPSVQGAAPDDSAGFVYRIEELDARGIPEPYFAG